MERGSKQSYSCHKQCTQYGARHWEAGGVGKGDPPYDQQCSNTHSTGTTRSPYVCGTNTWDVAPRIELFTA
jgi:hypothetical protein